MVKLDGLTKEILALLREDARRSYKEIAAAVHKPESTVRDRILRLERAGVIQRYSTVLDRRKLGLSTTALVLADVPYQQLEEVTKRLLAIPNVLQVHHTSGERRLAFVLAARDLEDLQGLLETQVAQLGFSDEEVVILLKTHREFGAPLQF